MKPLALIGFLLTLNAMGAIRLENAPELRKQWGLNSYPANQALKKMKIAVIDNGFAGFENDGKYLPTSTTVVSDYDPEFIKKFGLGDPQVQTPPLPTEHGRLMAQILWGITGANEGPRFFLLNGNGITMFRRAVRYAIEEKVDIILYSQNRECCGNFDGGGFLNEIVNQATNAGILWVNAAGNYGGQVFNGSYHELKELRLKSHYDENTAQVILMWNSSGPEEEGGTDKDLDLVILDENNNEVAKSELKQVLHKAELVEGETFLPRERIKFTFSKNGTGFYRLRVKTNSNNFGASDKIRIVVIPEKASAFDPEKNRPVPAVEFIDATKGREIMVPADNPNVITVGDMREYSARGPTEDGRQKPEILLETSMASFSNGQSSEGSSNAAAYFAGILAILKSHRPHLDRQTVISFAKKNLDAPSRIPLSELAALHGAILALVEQMTGESPLLAGRFNDGRYALGIRLSPMQVLSDYCQVRSLSNSLEFYLKAPRGGSKIECVTRESEERYPWESRGDRHAYVEVRQVAPGGSRPNPRGIWKTPTPEELLFNR